MSSDAATVRMMRRVMIIFFLGTVLVGGGALWLWHLRNLTWACDPTVVGSGLYPQCQSHTLRTFVSWALILGGGWLMIVALLDYSISSRALRGDEEVLGGGENGVDIRLKFDSPSNR
jgi:hypothetical protein